MGDYLVARDYFPNCEGEFAPPPLEVQQDSLYANYHSIMLIYPDIFLCSFSFSCIWSLMLIVFSQFLLSERVGRMSNSHYSKYINFQNFRTFNFRTFNFWTKIFGRNYYRYRTISDIFKQINKFRTCTI